MPGYRHLVLFFLLFSIAAFARTYVEGEYYEEGEIVKVDVRKLHPTQFAVGMEEVKERKKQLRETYELSKDEIKEELKDDAGSVVIGPKGVLYIIEGHHHARAHYDLKKYEAYMEIDKDWSDKTEREFWAAMKNRSGERKYTRTYLVDQNGKKRSEKELPKSLAGLKDNSYRSIVYYLIQAGIVEKEKGFPRFGEFKIADWLRPQVAVRDSHKRLRMKKATEEAAILLTREENQDEELPGQQQMKKRTCQQLLADYWSE